MPSMNENLEEVLGIEYKETSNNEVAVAAEKPKAVTEYIDTAKASKDFDEVTDSLKELVDQGKEAVTNLMKIARESENPRAYEVVSKLVKDTAEAAERIMTAHKTITEIQVLSHTKLNSDSGASVNIERAIFTGTTKELLKLAKDQKKKNG